MYDRIINIRDDRVFTNIIQYAIRKSSHVSFCTFRYYHKKDVNANFSAFMDEIAPFELTADIVNTFLLPRPYSKGQRFRVYILSSKLKNKILSVKSIGDWCVPNYPEDITFYTNQKPWIRTVTHEKFMFVEPANDEILKDLINLGAKIV